MAIPTDQTTINQYTASGIATKFAYTFLLNLSTDINVYITAKGASPAKTDLVDSSSYTVDGLGNESGGNVIFVVAPALNSTVTLVRAMQATIETDFGGNPKSFNAQNLDDALDREMMIAQQNKTNFISRSLRYYQQEILSTDQNLMPKLKTGQVWVGNTDSSPVAHTLSSNDDTLRSELSDEKQGEDGARLVGYYSNIDSETTVKLELDRINSSSAFSCKNYLLNPTFNVNQLGTSFTESDINKYSSDTWAIYSNDGANSGTFNIVVSDLQRGGDNYAYEWQQTTQITGARSGFMSFIPSVDSLFGTCTVSFEAGLKDDLNSYLDATVELVQHFGNTSTDEDVVTEIGTYSVTKQQSTSINLTFSVPTVNEKNITPGHCCWLRFIHPDQTNFYVYWEKVKIEISQYATNFEFPTLQESWDKCGKYFQVHRNNPNQGFLFYPIINYYASLAAIQNTITISIPTLSTPMLPVCHVIVQGAWQPVNVSSFTLSIASNSNIIIDVTSSAAGAVLLTPASGEGFTVDNRYMF